VTLRGIAESFITDPAFGGTEAGEAPGRSQRGKAKGTSSKKSLFSAGVTYHAAPSGPYLARTITGAELKLIGRTISRTAEHLQDCANSLLPRYYLIFRVGNNSTFSKAPHWAIMDNPNDLPLPVVQRFDIKGCPDTRITKVKGGESGSMLKCGNLPMVGGAHSFPQVSPWGVRQLLTALKADLALLEELLVIVAPKRGEGEESHYTIRAPQRKPYARLEGQDCTLFAFVVDTLQEWVAASSVWRVFTFFKGPAKAKEQLSASPEPFAARMLTFLEAAFHEQESKSENVNWANAVRTRASLSSPPKYDVASPTQPVAPPPSPED